MGVGAALGAWIAKSIKITELPQMVAGFHSLVGFAAAATSIASVMVHAHSSAELAALDGLHKVSNIAGSYSLPGHRLYYLIGNQSIFMY